MNWKVDLLELAERVREDPARYRDELPHIQTAVSVMCGGGFLGDFAATQPADFYIDSRMGQLPYGKRDIRQAVEVLQVIAQSIGLDPHSLPAQRHFHNCGVW